MRNVQIIQQFALLTVIAFKTQETILAVRKHAHVIGHVAMEVRKAKESYAMHPNSLR